MYNTLEKRLCSTCANKECSKAITRIEEKDMCTIKCNDYIKDKNKMISIKKITYVKRSTID